MQIKTVKLKGFKGFKAGMGVDEVALDFDKLPPGLIALVGKNGMGKTSLLDNLHPFRLMPYKLRESKEWSPAAFSYYEQCYGEASKELIFTMGNSTYRSLILIDADRRKQEAYLYRDDSMEQWNNPLTSAWTPLNDGKTRTYDAAVEKVAGSPSLFFSSVFRSQDARKLSSYPRSEILQIITELLNIDHIKEQGDKAKQVSEALLNDSAGLLLSIVKLDGEIEASAAITDSIAVLETGLRNSQMGLDQRKGWLADNQKQQRDVEVAGAAQVEAQKRLDGMKANLSDHNKGLTILYAEHQNRMEELRTALQGVQKEISSQTTFISSRNGVVESLRQHITTITSALEGMETHKTVASMEPVHTSNLAGVNADLERTTDEYRASVSAATAYNGKNTELTMKRLELENLKKQRAQELKTATDQYEDTLRRAQLLTMGDLDCKADGSGWVNDNCKLLKDAVAARDRLPVLAAARDALMYHSDEILALTADIETGEKWFADTPDPAVDIERLTEEGKRLRKESEKIAALLEESRAAAKTVADLQTKATMLEFKQKELTETLDSIKTAKEAIAALRETETGWLDKSDAAEEDYKQKVNAVVEKERALTLEIAELEKTLTGDVEKQLAELRLAAEDIQREITAHEHLVSKATGDIAVEKNKLAEIGHKKDERDRLAAERQTIDEEIVNWQLITKACSNDGIIALELDDAGPAIAGLANDLLLACYGPRFSVRLETQSVKADGTLKETFDITVFDSERDEEKSIRDMSGGEVTTIEDAIARAICLYNLGKSSVVYDTLFSDEKDGALDAHRKVEFLQIKRRAMELGTHSREIFISQTPELHEMADARIVLTSAGVVIQ